MKKLMLLLPLLLLAVHPQAKERLFMPGLAQAYDNQRVNPATLVKAVEFTSEAADLLCISDQTDTMLAMWHRESDFEPLAFNPCLRTPNQDSLGICQTQRADMQRWRKFWLKRGIKLGPFKNVGTQVYFGVAEFYTKLQANHGDVLLAVERYNGKGKQARKYASKVMKFRAKFFNRPYKMGEHQATAC